MFNVSCHIPAAMTAGQKLSKGQKASVSCLLVRDPGTSEMYLSQCVSTMVETSTQRMHVSHG